MKASNTQNYNRYGYCLNNPLKYTDPSGEIIETLAWGAGIALASYFLTSIMNDQPLTLMGALKSIAVGAISGAVTFGIGELFNGVTTFALKATYQALAHGTFQGLVSGVQGGGFWTGFAAGAISSLASSLYQGVGHDNGGWHGLGGCGATGETGMIIFGTVMGGASSVLTGGNFWQGAATGLMVSALNHAQKHGVKRNSGVLDDLQNEESDIYRVFKSILGKKIGTKITSDELIKEYGIESKIKKAINSVKLVSKNKVYVDWNNEGKINSLSKINVKDGILEIKSIFIPDPNNKDGKGWNGYRIDGGLEYDPNIFSGTPHSPVFLTKGGGVFGYFPKTNTKTHTGAFL